jgi:hypothetical protein
MCAGGSHVVIALLCDITFEFNALVECSFVFMADLHADG